MVLIFHIKKYCFIKFIYVLLFFFLILLIYQIFEFLHHGLSNGTLNCQYDEKIDIVYTWVNGSDSEFIKNLNEYLTDKNIICDTSKQRFDDKYELKFSLRSLEKYAPWVNHVYVVTNGQIPYWLDLDYEKVTVVVHDEIFKDNFNLPTFSSPAIESNIHRIPGLSKKFIYFNDDIFLASPIYPEDFYTPSKGYLIYLAWPVPNCASNCLWIYVNDGQCDKDCYRPECQMDGSDCDEPEEQKRIFDEFTTENLNEENETISLALAETVKKVQTNFYHSFLKKLNSINDTDNTNIQNTINFTPTVVLTRNISNIVRVHNDNFMKKDKLKRYIKKRNLPKSRRWYFEKFKFTRNIDAYSASLQHSHRVFNKKYGYHTRKVPSHAPILIDKDIMYELEQKFLKELQVTEGNKVRQKDDMQFSFTYYNFIMSEQRNRTIEEIFDEFDTDSSNTWSDREIRTLLTQLYELPLSYGTVDHFETILTDCYKQTSFYDVPTPPYERYVDSKLPVISKYLVKNCQYLHDLLLPKFEKVFRYKFEVVPNSESSYVSFTMLNSNISDVVSNLDEIRRNRRKFVCLNDNLDESKESENELVRAILYDFYLSLFPNPSKFELPQELRNKFSYVKELNEWKYNRWIVKLCLYSLIFMMLYFIFFNLCKKKCYQVANIFFC